MAKSRRILLDKDGPELSKTVAGLMRLNEWGYDDEKLSEWIQQCVDIGITSFDHADIYGSYTCEGIFGRALSKTNLRSEIELITKCGIQLISENRPETKVKHYDTSRDHILASVERSLLNLQTDYIDLLLIHRPDPLFNADEVAQALSELLDSGEVKGVGVSNFMPAQFDLLQSRMDAPLLTNQIELSVTHPHAFYDHTLDQCQFLDIHPMTWSPLSGGSFFNPINDQSHRLHDVMTVISDELGGIGIDQIALAWINMHPSDPINVMGTRSISRLISAVEAESVKLSRQQWFRILEASHDEEVP